MLHMVWIWSIRYKLLWSNLPEQRFNLLSLFRQLLSSPMSTREFPICRLVCGLQQIKFNLIKLNSIIFIEHHFTIQLSCRALSNSGKEKLLCGSYFKDETLGLRWRLNFVSSTMTQGLILLQPIHSTVDNDNVMRVFTMKK